MATNIGQPGSLSRTNTRADFAMALGPSLTPVDPARQTGKLLERPARKGGTLPSNARVEDRIKELIVELLFLKDVAPSSIGDEDVLEETLGVDSVALFQIVAGLEEAFDIRFQDEDFVAEKFRTVKAIANVVRQKRGEAGPQ